MHSTYFLLTSLSLALTLSPGFANAQLANLPDYENQLAAIQRSGMSELDYNQQLNTVYLRYFNQQTAIDTLKDEELREFFKINRNASFYSNHSLIISHLVQSSHQLAARKLAQADDFQVVYDTLIAANQFEQAGLYRQRYPEANLAAIPLTIAQPDETSHYSFWRVQQAQSGQLQLQGEQFRFQPGLQVVVLSHPNCHFSKNLFRAIQQDQELQQQLPPSTLWLAPATRGNAIQTLLKWNQSQPDFQHVLSYKTAAWPFIKIIATPSIFIFKDGVLKHSVIGWPKEGRKQELLEGLK